MALIGRIGGKGAQLSVPQHCPLKKWLNLKSIEKTILTVDSTFVKDDSPQNLRNLKTVSIITL